MRLPVPASKPGLKQRDRRARAQRPLAATGEVTDDEAFTFSEEQIIGILREQEAGNIEQQNLVTVSSIAYEDDSIDVASHCDKNRPHIETNTVRLAASFG